MSSAQKSSPYFYWFGGSWQSYTADLCVIAINVVDTIGTDGPMPIGAVYIYRVSFFVGLVAARSVYYLLCRLSRPYVVRGSRAADRQFSVV